MLALNSSEFWGLDPKTAGVCAIYPKIEVPSRPFPIVDLRVRFAMPVISLVALTALLAHTNRRALLSFAETQVRV
jgi:hypothetical protein